MTGVDCPTGKGWLPKWLPMHVCHTRWKRLPVSLTTTPGCKLEALPCAVLWLQDAVLCCMMLCLLHDANRACSANTQAASADRRPPGQSSAPRTSSQPPQQLSLPLPPPAAQSPALYGQPAPPPACPGSPQRPVGGSNTAQGRAGHRDMSNSRAGTWPLQRWGLRPTGMELNVQKTQVAVLNTNPEGRGSVSASKPQ